MMVTSIPDALHKVSISKLSNHIISRISNTSFRITAINDM